MTRSSGGPKHRSALVGDIGEGGGRGAAEGGYGGGSRGRMPGANGGGGGEGGGGDCGGRGGIDGGSGGEGGTLQLPTVPGSKLLPICMPPTRNQLRHRLST